jgi:site-specific DNA-methyltransferase (adenine-specific)
VSSVRLLLGDSLVRIPNFEDGTFDSVICDPPYDLTAVSRGGSARVEGTGPYGRHKLDTKDTKATKGFMGKTWDGTGIAFRVDLWAEVLRVLKVGGVAKVFGGTRTFHRMAAAMVEAGFQDVQIEAWGYGSGFPKSLNVGKALDKMAGAEREKKKIGYSGNAVLRSGGQNTRPWMEEALKKGYHELPGDDPVSDHAKTWDGWGTALKPSWEPVLVGYKR